MTFRDVADTKLGTKQTQDASKHQSTLKGKQYHNDDGTRMMEQVQGARRSSWGDKDDGNRFEEHGGQVRGARRSGWGDKDDGNRSEEHRGQAGGLLLVKSRNS